MENKIKIKKKLIAIFWVFIIGSIFGCIIETTVQLLVEETLHLRKGLIYGPFIPVYGVGAVMYYFIVTNIKSPIKVFLASVVLGGAVEYFCSFFQQIFYGTVSWDYSNMAFNLNGRTSLLHCMFWGVCGIFFVMILYPLILKFLQNYDKKEFRAVTIAFLIFMIFNITISCAAGSRQKERVNHVPPKSFIDNFLDKYYPDSKMDKIYTNKIVKGADNKWIVKEHFI